MELFKGGKSDNTSGYSDEEGKKIDAFVAEAHAFFRRFEKTLDAGMLCDSIIVAAASSIGNGFRNKEAFNRNLPRLVGSFKNVMTHAFEKAEATRLGQNKGR